jgi:hypothetical protein
MSTGLSPTCTAMLLVGMVLVDLIHPAEWENPTPEQIRLIKMCCDTFGLPRGLHD